MLLIPRSPPMITRTYVTLDDDVEGSPLITGPGREWVAAAASPLWRSASLTGAVVPTPSG
jgi:hypothetical protein